MYVILNKTINTNLIKHLKRIEYTHTIVIQILISNIDSLAYNKLNIIIAISLIYLSSLN